MPWPVLSDLEDITGEDYDALDGVSDTNITAQLTRAERHIIGYVGTDYGDDPPDAVKGVVLNIAERLVHNFLYRKGITVDPPELLDMVTDDDLAVLDVEKSQNDDTRNMWIEKQYHWYPRW